MKKSELSKMIREEIKTIKEAEVTLPAEVKRFMGKFIAALKSSSLNRKRQLAVLGGVINSMKIDPSRLLQIVKKIKRGMDVDEGRYTMEQVTEAVLTMESKKPLLTEGAALSKEQKAFAEPIFKAAAKKGKFKIKKMYMSFQPQCEFEVYQYGKSSSSMTHIWGNCFTKAEANDIKKAWERSDMDLQIAEKGYKPKFYIGKDSDYMTLYYAAEFSGMKYDRDEYDRLFRDK